MIVTCEEPGCGFESSSASDLAWSAFRDHAQVTGHRRVSKRNDRGAPLPIPLGWAGDLDTRPRYGQAPRDVTVIGGTEDGDPDAARSVIHVAGDGASSATTGAVHFITAYGHRFLALAVDETREDRAYEYTDGSVQIVPAVTPTATWIYRMARNGELARSIGLPVAGGPNKTLKEAVDELVRKLGYVSAPVTA